MTSLVTGSAGFIGFHLARKLLDQGEMVVGLDNVTPYYDPALKRARLHLLDKYPNYEHSFHSILDESSVERLIHRTQPSRVYHLAAQAGVRYSLEAPEEYIETNIMGTHRLLNSMINMPPEHFVFASTSSIYGGNQDLPFEETQRTAFPVSLYAATKASAESLIHANSHLHGTPSTVVRFFTVYGPWGRPDMALFKFAERILKGEAIDVYGQGEMARDFTYVDDLVNSMIALSGIPPVRAAGPRHPSDSPVAAFRTVNVAQGRSVGLEEFISALEEALGVKARRNYLPMQPGDMKQTYADPSQLRDLIGKTPETGIHEGVAEFAKWFRTERFGE